MQDEYFYGDSLLVAPVVTRGLTSRAVFLPDASTTITGPVLRVTGGGYVTAQAPLDVVPVFAKVGGIIPMLSADVETVFPSSDGGVVSMQDRADFLEVQVFAGADERGPAGRDDALTVGSEHAVRSRTTVVHGGAAIAQASSPAEPMTCQACFWNEPATHVFSLAVVTASDSITAGGLTVGVSASPSTKRYLFTVRHLTAAMHRALFAILLLAATSLGSLVPACSSKSGAAPAAASLDAGDGADGGGIPPNQGVGAPCDSTLSNPCRQSPACVLWHALLA